MRKILMNNFCPWFCRCLGVFSVLMIVFSWNVRGLGKVLKRGGGGRFCGWSDDTLE